ncbi:sugar ABC transporter ATP-binding protein [Agathobacter ruminis]|uniref:Sugar ABC transporter ATP-binding protein n=1 Tax=Agathobacter ruminis TaxID=1712665 RepID=A0A2G3E287_9FIRM|nr:sugar ABC transporter ATP-binding protein [Agathobacter ruminis]PHU37265.1 sugar ABC transporter ATP-binding protein [Agathobacter ruminis]
MVEPILQMKKITKKFGSVTALSEVDLAVYPGEIRGLIGENGSGKSTISSIAAGMQKANSGEMIFKNKAWAPQSMIDALDNGIGMVVQESGTIAGITVGESIFLGELDPFTNRLGWVNKKAMFQKATEAMEAIGVTSVTGDMPMSALDFQTRKLVEIAKVVRKNPSILVIDETSTALSHDGREIMYRLIKKFRDDGKAVIFISHDLDEIMEVCDTLTVLRDGNLIRTFTKEEYDANLIRTSMIGRELKGDYYRSDFKATSLDEIALEAKNLKYKEQLKDISLQLKKGEIVGIGGLAGCGMHALGKALFGALPLESGEVVTGTGKKITDPHVAMKQEIGYVSKDRDTESLSLTASIRDNIAIAGMDRFAIGGFLVTAHKESKYVKEQIENLSIKCASPNQSVSQLSGGNKQKVVFGKWIGCGSEILILDCPTRGVDIGVKQAMYQLMVQLKNEGKAILMISEELPELIGMSDRIFIMKDGEMKMEFKRSEMLSDADIIQYMI